MRVPLSVRSLPAPSPALRPPAPALAALLLGGAATFLYAATLQAGVWNDGFAYIGMLEDPRGQLASPHLVHLPLTRLVRLLGSSLPGLDAEGALKLTAALGGGVTVGLGYRVALEVLGTARRALASSSLLALLSGLWFHATTTEVHSLHAACATLLLWTLLRVLRDAGQVHPARWALLALAVALTPGSHLSGAGCLLPLLVVRQRLPHGRRAFTVAAASGLALLGLALLVLELFEGRLSAYGSVFLPAFLRILDEPELVAKRLFVWAREFGLDALPAAVLVPAGLRVLWHRDRGQAWLLAAWMAGWSLVAAQVTDRGHGSYYVPTLPAQATLAVLATAALAPGSRGAWSLALAGVLPAPLLLLLGVGPAVTCLLALALAVWARSAVPARSAAQLAPLPLAALLVSGLTYLPERSKDPLRERIAAIEREVRSEHARTRHRGLIVFLGFRDPWAVTWKSEMKRKQDPPWDRLHPPSVGIHPDPERRRQRLRAQRRAIDEAFRVGRGVWVVDAPGEVLRARPPLELRVFLEGLVDRYELEPRLPGLYRLRSP